MSGGGPVCLVVLDGFGIGDGGRGDATALADTPFLQRARELYPYAELDTSGPSVGLPPGQMGNSEVGHMTLGAGRVIEQDVARIQKAVAAGPDLAHGYTTTCGPPLPRVRRLPTPPEL